MPFYLFFREQSSHGVKLIYVRISKDLLLFAHRNDSWRALTLAELCVKRAERRSAKVLQLEDI